MTNKLPASCVECPYGERYGAVGDMKCKMLGQYFTNNVQPPYAERPDECPLPSQTDEKADSKTFRFSVYDIEWDADGEDADLPDETTVVLTVSDCADVEDLIGDALSDDMGWCVKNFRYERIE